MTLKLAHALLDAAALYTAIGVLVAVPLVFFGLSRIDPGTKAAPPAFCALVFPGLVALWPFFAARWMTTRTRS
jgi:hypothetical protein